MKGLGLRRGDCAVIALAVLVAVVCGCLLWWPRPVGQTVLIVSPEGEQRYALDTDRQVVVYGLHASVLTVEVKNGRVCVKDSTCPDRVCVHSGWLSEHGQTAACVPAGVSVRVIGGSPTVDGVTA